MTRISLAPLPWSLFPPAPHPRYFARPTRRAVRWRFIAICVLGGGACLALAARTAAEGTVPTGSETAPVVEATDLATSALGSAGLEGTGLDSTDLVDVDQVDVDAARWAKMPLVLNGRGTRNSYRRIVIRDVAFKVYDAELYVPEPTADSGLIIYDYPTIEIRFTFHRNVSPSELRNSALGSFRNLLPNMQQYRAHAENRERFISYMASSGVKKGDQVVVRFSDDTVQISVNGEQRGVIKSHDFQQLARRIWLDKSLPDRGLTELRLGLLDHRAIAGQLPTRSTISAAGQ